jgi:hypothetical protein
VTLRAHASCVAFALLAWASPLFAATHVHAIVIGNNNGFVGGRPGGAEPRLRYADDDAAAFAELLAPIAESSELLTVMDRDTQERYPKLAGVARVPTREALRASVARLRERLRAERRAGERQVVFVFFSGHGALDYDGQPALALADGGLGHAFLYRDVLAELPADEIHLLLDACHAEAVVRPRDADAQSVAVSPAQASAFLLENTLARFPNTGAIMAASTDAKAHEWDAVRHGVFTHELLSALRGAADVNGDLRLEYSEVYAFMAAANREVSDARARLAIVARPPDANRRAVLLTLSAFPPERSAWLTNVPGAQGIVTLDDGHGRLVTLHGDRDFSAALLIPAGAKLYVRASDQEASFSAAPGEVVSFARLEFAPSSLRERGPLEDALRHGLFAAEYGRRYYDGVVDQAPAFLPVEFTTADHGVMPESALEPPSFWSRQALVLGGGVSTGVADVIALTHGVNAGLRPVDRSGPALSLAALFAGEGALEEWRARASIGWLWVAGGRKLHLQWGGLLGAGLMSQSVSGERARTTGFFELSPVLGLSASVTDGFGLWSELELSGAGYRRDGALAWSFMPSAWLGAGLRL